MAANLHQNRPAGQSLVRVHPVGVVSDLSGWQRVERELGRVEARSGLVAGQPVDVNAATAAVINNETVFVQCRKRGAVLCGRLLRAVTAGENEFVEVRTQIADLWVTAANTRVCSGDGRCSCEDGAESRQAHGSGFAVPLGNTGTTTVEGA